METKELNLQVGGSQEIQLVSRGASGLQLLFSADPSDVVSIERRDLTTQEQDSLGPTIGGGIPAYFSIKGLKSGQSTVLFYEKPAGNRSGPQIPIVTYQIVVK